jgi:hypothetical protein
VFALLVSSLVISCKSTRQIDGAPVEEEAPGAKNKPIETSPSTTGQGIRGQVFWVEGNRMPQANVSGEPATHPPKKKPVQRTVRIHKLTHINEASLGDYLFGDIETTLVAEIQTDESGFFEVRLPPGSYSLFTVEEKGYFANVFDLDSYVHPVTVKRNAWETTQITIDYMASY